jgi:hypothetical protein
MNSIAVQWHPMFTLSPQKYWAGALRSIRLRTLSIGVLLCPSQTNGSLKVLFVLKGRKL